LCEEAAAGFSKRAKVTSGLHLGDRSSYHRILDEAGKVIQEGRVGTSKKAMVKVFGSLAAVESPCKSASILRR
jgi:hypothetical protein